MRSDQRSEKLTELKRLRVKQRRRKNRFDHIHSESHRSLPHNPKPKTLRRRPNKPQPTADNPRRHRFHREKLKRLPPTKTSNHKTRQNLSRPRERTHRLHHTQLYRASTRHNPLHLRIPKHAKNGKTFPTPLLSLKSQLPNVLNQIQKIR